MIRPPLLQKGNTIGIVAPGRKIDQDSISSAVEILKSWGLQVVLGKKLFSKNHSYLSGEDAERLEDFQAMVDNGAIKAIICARGGYGSTRILDAIDFTSFHKNPKWIVGFSDITAIHLKLFSLGFESIHGTMPILFSNPVSSDSVESLRKILFEEAPVLATKKSPVNRFGNATGQTIGGNLSLLIDSLGTNSEPDTRKKILILEEVDEYRYRIDRMMIQLKRAGKLEGIAGLVIGHFTNIKDTELSFGETFEEIILRTVREYTYPVAFGFPVGHENPNLAWRHGGTGVLQVNEDGAKLLYS